MKILTSSIKTLPGTVGLFDPIPLDKLYLIEELMFERSKTDLKPQRRAELHKEFFSAVFGCVEEWKLEGLPQNLSLSDLGAGKVIKRKVLAELESWLTNEVMALYYEEQEASDPNG